MKAVLFRFSKKYITIETLSYKEFDFENVLD